MEHSLSAMNSNIGINKEEVKGLYLIAMSTLMHLESCLLPLIITLIQSMHYLLSAIRNITALTGWVSDYSSQFAVSHSGAFYYNNTRRDGFVPTSYLQKAYSGTFNANLDSNDYGNPMAGHAGDANEIRPYTIYALPLIAY